MKFNREKEDLIYQEIPDYKRHPGFLVAAARRFASNKVLITLPAPLSNKKQRITIRIKYPGSRRCRLLTCMRRTDGSSYCHETRGGS